MVIGIPRALFYWKQPYFWEIFFKELGFKIVLSPLTNKEIVERGVKIADPETCFSIKILQGHILWLAENKVDYIFVPRIKSLSPGFISCPKFFGLPDVAKTFTKVKILAPLIDLNKTSLRKSLFKIGLKFLNSPQKINSAYQLAQKAQENYQESLKDSCFQKIKSDKLKIVLISHPYNLYDDYVNLQIRERLEKLGAEVITIDSVFPVKEERPGLHWDFAQERMEELQGAIKIPGLAGVIELSAFQCGCDAVLKELIEREVKQNKIPFLYLLLDEHTAEAGLQTRLEAFIDTLQ